MFKTICNITSTLKDLSVVASKETAFQLAKANDTSATATGKLANKAASMRQQYEQKLRERKAKASDPTQKVIEILQVQQQEQNN